MVAYQSYDVAFTPGVNLGKSILSGVEVAWGVTAPLYNTSGSVTDSAEAVTVSSVKATAVHRSMLSNDVTSLRTTSLDLSAHPVVVLLAAVASSRSAERMEHPVLAYDMYVP